jgi:hypothetical protein
MELKRMSIGEGKNERWSGLERSGSWVYGCRNLGKGLREIYGIGDKNRHVATACLFKEKFEAAKPHLSKVTTILSGEAIERVIWIGRHWVVFNNWMLQLGIMRRLRKTENFFDAT